MPPAIAQPVPEKLRSGTSRLFAGLIWGFCLLLVAGIWWFVIAQTRFEHDRAMEDGVRQNENRAIAFEQYVRRTLEAADLVTRYVGTRYARGEVGSEFRGVPGRPSVITGNVARNGTFLAVTVTDAEGNIVATSVSGRLPISTLAEHPAFRSHAGATDDGLHVSQPVFSPLAGQKVVWLSRRLIGPNGAFQGVIAITILPDQFTAFYRDAQVSRLDVMSVIGLDGITRARRTGPVSSSGEDMRGRPAMEEQMRNPNGTSFGASTLDGVVRIYSHRRLQGYPLFVAYGVPEAEVLAPSRRRARIFIGAAALLSLTIIAFAALLTLNLNRRERRFEALDQANRRLEEAQRVGQIGDWDYDLRTGETFWSPQLRAMYERETMPTLEEFLACLDDAGRTAVAQAHADAIRTGEPQEVEYAVRLPSGTESHHQSAVIPGFDAGGNVVRLHGVDQNISARKLLDRLQAHVAHLSRVEAMNAMAATLAHELNQPLTAASNYLAGSRRMLKGGTPGEAEEGMIAAEEQVHLAADIIRRVREMVANLPRAVTAVSLDRVIDDAAALLAMPRLFPGLALRKDLAADAREVGADRIQLQQVIMNLIRNAGDATAGRSDAELVISSRTDEAGHVILCFADNGPGFSQAADERFSPFASGKEGGLGLGLSISRTIVEAHGGRIWTEDEDGGARVCFSLPPPPRDKRKPIGEKNPIL